MTLKWAVMRYTHPISRRERTWPGFTGLGGMISTKLGSLIVQGKTFIPREELRDNTYGGAA